MSRESELLRLATLYSAELSDIDSLHQWADTEVRASAEPHPDAVELFSRDRNRVVQALDRVIDSISPELRKELAQKVDRSLLKEFCERLLDDDLRAVDLCSLVVTLDAKYNDDWEYHGVPEGVGWLGDLWSACDWCDEDWGRDTAPYLYEEAERVLNRLR